MNATCSLLIKSLYPYSLPSLNVQGTKKKVVGFVDQVSPDRYNRLLCGARFAVQPNSDSSEAKVSRRGGQIFFCGGIYYSTPIQPFAGVVSLRCFPRLH